MPTAESLEARQVSVQREMDNGGAPPGATGSYALYTQVGVTSRWEVGVDVHYVRSGSRAYFNTKYVVMPQAQSAPAVAVGVLNIASGSVAEPYVVASRSFGSLALHSGLLRAEGQWAPMGGGSLSVGERLSIKADFLAGSPGVTTVGAKFTVTEMVALKLYQSRGRNRIGRDGDFTGINLEWRGRIW